MMSENLASIKTPEMDKLAFTVLEIEASAKKDEYFSEWNEEKTRQSGAYQKPHSGCYV